MNIEYLVMLSGEVIQKGISLAGSINTGESISLSGNIKCSTVDKDAPRYQGTYEVTPKSYEQTLFTDKKMMEDNVRVFRIPYSEVSNPSGGLTVNIGEF